MSGWGDELWGTGEWDGAGGSPPPSGTGGWGVGGWGTMGWGGGTAVQGIEMLFFLARQTDMLTKGASYIPRLDKAASA